ncbi:MAG: tetratricopeptide repeat protein [Capsulimonadales bacterium]|nr:tetratricopeptide repeat protein [Capsulimonadales bacterium]
MRHVPIFLCLGTLFLAGCARPPVASTERPAEPTRSEPASSDAIGLTELYPLPGIAEENPPPGTILGLDRAETAQAERPDDPKANLDLAYSYYKARAFADAARCFDRAAQLLPDDPAPLLYLGYTQMSVGALDNALKTFDRVVRLKGVSRDTLSEAYYHIGVCQATLKRTDEAIAAYSKAIGNNPKNGRASLALGARAAERGQFEQAADFFRDAAADLPIGRQKAQAYAALGKLAEDRKDVKAAVVAYKKALAIDRGNVWAENGMRRLSSGKNG